MRTAAHELADLKLGRPVTEYVAEKRADGKAWRVIARDLYLDTNGEVDVTHETLRSWCGAEPEAASA